jgi:hypothetical protein
VGASTVKWTEIVLQCIEIIVIVVIKGLEVVANCFFKLIFFLFMMTCFGVLNKSRRMSSWDLLKLIIIKSDAQKRVVEYGLERRFHDLQYFKVGIFSHIP